MTDARYAQYENLLRLLIQQSNCFIVVERGRAMANMQQERALQQSGEMRQNSNFGKGQMVAADYSLTPEVLMSARGTSGLGAALGGFGGRLGALGAIAGGISVKKGEANVTLSIVNARTTEEMAMTEGYYRKSDLSWGAGGGLFSGGTFGAAGATGYQNTAIGQVIVLAYLDAYTKLVTQLGGLPENAAAAAPQAKP